MPRERDASGIRALLLVCSAAEAERVRAALRARPAWVGYRIDVRVADGAAASLVRPARQEQGDAPLAYLACTEEDVIDALRAGADDATVEGAEVASVMSFVDRWLVRAQMRRADATTMRTAAQAEKLEALATLVSGVAHEVNNPLSAIMLSVSAFQRHHQTLMAVVEALLGATESNEALTAARVAELAQGLRMRDGGNLATQLQRLFGDVLAASETIAQVVRDLHLLARSEGNDEVTAVRLPEVIDRAIRLVSREIGHRAIVERDYDDALPLVHVPRVRITQVVTNLLVNAAHAIAEVERDTHRIRVTARSDGDCVIIQVSDTGPGVSPMHLERVFDPFFTTKREGMGTGLGLSISRSILEQLGGELLVESAHGEGATFICILPVGEARGATSPVVRGQVIELVAPPKGPPSLLLIEDDRRVLRSYARLLGRDYRVIVATDGLEAIELIQSGTQVDAIVSELDLPERDAIEVHEWLREHAPALAERVLYVSGARDQPRFADFVAPRRSRVMWKPAPADELERALRDLVGAEAGDEAERTRR